MTLSSTTALGVVVFVFGLAGTASGQFQLSSARADKSSKAPAPRVLPLSGPGGGFFGGGDDCSAPTPIAGQGTFAYDSSAATTGSEGQVESLCDFFGSSALEFDVWFTWTADTDGIASLATCGTPFDTKIAVYPAGGCPADGTALACNDDACFLQSAVTFPVTVGQEFLFQLGSYQGTTGGLGTFELAIAGLPTNDDCATPTSLFGQGVFAYDNTAATTGTQGQTELLCLAFGDRGVDRDIWFDWTADADGIAVISTCGSVPDTKLAAYPGGGCPANGTSLVCNDDTCGVQSTILFPVAAGSSYLLQVGNFPSASGGPGMLDITIEEVPDCYEYDGGASTNSIGLTTGGGVAWLQGFEAVGGADVLTEVSTAFGTAAFPGLTPGQAATLVLYDDPTNDYDPTDGVLLYSTSIVTSEEDTDTLVPFTLPAVPVSGVFFVGFVADNIASEFPVPLDETLPSGGRAWLVGNTTASGGFGSFDYAGLGNNDVPPTDLDLLGFPGVYLLRAVGDNCGDSLGTSYCTSAPNSVSNDGSRISAGGSTSLAAMDLVLRADNAPTQPALFYFGPGQVSLAFGNGFRCVGGSVVRMDPFAGSGGVFTYSVDFGVHGSALASMGTANFQCWYRDPAAGGAAFNLSDGVRLVFAP